MPAYAYNPHISGAIKETLAEVQAKGINYDRGYQAILSSRSEVEAHRWLSSLGLTPADELGVALTKAHAYEQSGRKVTIRWVT